MDVPAQVARLQAHSATLAKALDMHEKRGAAALARALARKRAGDGKGALLEMKKRKLALGQVDKLNNMIATAEAQAAALQTMQLNASHLAVLDGGASAMMALQKQVNSDTLDAVRDKFEEAMDTHAEIEAAMSETWAAGAAAPDDADLNAELDALLEADLAADLVAPAPVAAGAAGVAAPAAAGAGVPAAAAAAAAAPAAAPLPAMPEVPTERVVSPPKPAAAAAAHGGDMMAELAGLS